MTKRLFWIIALSLLSGVLGRYEDCEVAPSVKFATVRIEDDEDSVRAVYSCFSGYTLEGETELICDLDSDVWNADPPTCVKIKADDDADNNAEENEIDDANGDQQKKNNDIQEDPYITVDYAENLDMSCVSARVKAPEIRNGFVQKYDRRRKGEHVFIVAFYSCNDNFELEDSDRNVAYCSKKKWIGTLPNCIALSDYDEEDYDGYDDGGEEEDDDEVAKAKPPVVAPPPHAETSKEVEYTVKVSQEETEATPTAETTVAVDTVVQGTSDPYSPKVLDQSCGPDKGSCDHHCEMVMYPGENEARVRCTCSSGFTLDPYDYRRCHDIDECDINNGGCEQICNNSPGSYQCSCREGLQIDTATGNTCIDINECESPDIASKCPAGCENTPGSYVCLQPSPEEETRSNEVEPEVEQERTAETTPEPGLESEPKNIPPFHMIECEQGFHLSSDGNCVDIDECSEGIARCENCRNTHGSYECTCSPGFELSDDEITCVDVNECEAYDQEPGEENPTPYKLCSHECENTHGSFVCKCSENFHLDVDRRTCIQDMCEDLNKPELNKSRCAYYCEDSENGPMCKCPDQYELGEDRRTCIPKTSDACQENGGKERCFPGSCHSSEDSSYPYKCSCPAGYKDEVYFCKDIDECSEGTHNCSHICFNTEGSFACSCPIGFKDLTPGSTTCEDIDECIEKPGVCGDKICRNTEGSFVCLCPGDREPDENGECPSEDPCSDNNNGCSQICNSHLHGTCSCEPGYELQDDGRTCRDYDECIDNNGGCQHICVNNPGSFSCACESGFELMEDLQTCTDVDECAQSIHDCSHECSNIVGGYECACPTGFVLSPNKRTCIDVDECTGYSGCSHICRNILGSFECECPAGMILDEDQKTCINGDFCARLRPQCSHFCENTRDGFKCGCPTGYILGNDSLTCVDINECLENNGGCSHSCMNLEGSFKCDCPPGYRNSYDNTNVCEDVNECDVSNGRCDHYCINSKGSAYCECKEGYLLQPDGFSCRLLDPCAVNNGGCQHLCVPSEASARCACRSGYALSPADNSSCLDIDECVTNVCPQGNCRNTPGSYECGCQPGYTTNHYGSCVDIDECRFQNGGCSNECANLPGTYECRCHRGLRLSGDKKTCIEIRDQCQPFRPPKYGEIHCTRSRHKTQLYYRTKCKVWCLPGYRLEGPAIRHCNPSGQWDNYENRCVPLTCPPLSKFEHGTFTPANCLLGNPLVGEHCRVYCDPGYVPVGNLVAICRANQTWSHNSTFNCLPYGTPVLHRPPVGIVPRPVGVAPRGARLYIRCPRNTTVLLPAGHHTAHIILQKPKTNIDYRYIESFPAWTRSLQAHLGAGVHSVTFRGRDPNTRRGVSCRTVITVKKTEHPRVTFCPSAFEVSLMPNQDKRSIVWQEPQFSSDTQIKHIHKSNIPGQLFGEGVHRISYEAVDVDGLTARCEFNIVVKAPAPVVQSLPYTHGYSQFGDRSAKLLANHDTYIICAGQAPVKIFGNQPINLPPGCYVKNVRINPVRQYMRRRLITQRWTPFSSF